MNSKMNYQELLERIIHLEKSIDNTKKNLNNKKEDIIEFMGLISIMWNNN